MNKNVYIVHGSAIVKKGLADILLKNYKCSIECFDNLNSLLSEKYHHTSKSVFFIENQFINSKEYIQFLENTKQTSLFCISNCLEDKTHENIDYTIYLYNTKEEIFEKVKNAFNQQEVIEEESEGLSSREIDVLKLVALGYSNKEIAEKLFISIHTVMSHRKNITEKLGIKSISGLTVYAIINNYIDTTNLNLKDLI